jgi:hypothetical protein
VQPPQLALQALDLIERGLDRNASTITQIGQSIADALPELPAVPFASRLPSGEQVVRQTFAVADRLLQIQREYALKVAEALKPLREKVAHAGTNGTRA